MFLVLIIILIGISAISKSIQDTLSHHYSRSVFYNMSGWWSNDWTLLWKNGNKNEGERFWGSSTIFAWACNAWHCFDFINTISLFICILFAGYHFCCNEFYWWKFILGIFFMLIYFGLVFEVFYNFVWIKKK